jgi:hypothetical protein
MYLKLKQTITLFLPSTSPSACPSVSTMIPLQFHHILVFSDSEENKDIPASIIIPALVALWVMIPQ